MQEFILPIRDNMTIEKARDLFPNLNFQATDKAIYFDAFMDYTEDVVSSVKTSCPNCRSPKVVPIVFWSKENEECASAGEVVIAPGAYDNPGVPYGNYGCRECGYRWYYRDF